MARRSRREPSQPQRSPEEFAESLPDEYLFCRVWGHHWKPTGRAVETGRNRAEQDAQCLTCTSEKTLEIYIARGRARTGKSPRRYPTDPPYLAKNVARGLNREVFRFEQIRRERAENEAAAG